MSGLEGVALIADDNGVTRYMVARHVQDLGLTVVTANNGLEALARLAERTFDVLLLDVLMPELDGLGVLTEIKNHPEWRELPVIMISGVEETKTAATCIEAGAEDYLTKPIDVVLLHARIKAVLERRRLRQTERRYYRAMLESQEALRAEMEAAAIYVRSLLPAPVRGDRGKVDVDWRFIPSEQMGGDAFGYHWVGDDALAIYLLDVCGHGFRATLLAASVLNVLRSETLSGASFGDPATVLAALNDAFLMERQGGNYFTIWYGVYRPSTGQLTYASSGHPPALLLAGPDRRPIELATASAFLGAQAGTTFPSATHPIAPGDELFVYSDGAFEVSGSDGRMEPFEAFVENLRRGATSADEALDRAVQFVAERATNGVPGDDFSMVRLLFR